ncbi:LytTR family DNA-binding domain-containing protein [Aquimarina sp. 2201CG5-10]|uniref:LytR/AlgR family response regulator transcription factor n=1 Tax=Aquimarina callyspongiae TaxID=3098150 RepID=UPI002AB591D2|nr:LytTR family DNA-binding domain-containing protein [Aquimarina sp. 2201CG5-10]MDY8137995.1 LytTR family DNA-binding domain-containing protein [Aquimarina sp. 2201CG5-10]
MKIQCLLIDDEPLAIKIIEKHLESFDNFEIVHSCTNAIDAFNIIAENPIDLIFLDINMPKLNGIEFIKNLDNPPYIIITTGYHEYAVEGFELDVVDYLIKPVSLKRLMKSLNKVSRLISRQYQPSQDYHSFQYLDIEDHFFVKVNKKMVKIYFGDILYIESLKDYVSIKTVYEDYITHYNLSAITKLLPVDKFMRIHRSYTIALHKVKAIDGNSIEMDTKMIPIGRNYVKTVKSKLLSGLIH